MTNQAQLPAPQARSQMIIGLSFLLCLSLVLMLGLVKLLNWLDDEQRAPLQKIIISGQRQFIDDANIEKLVRQSQPGSFFELDVSQTHQMIEALPWVYRASVRKRWPNGLEIYVVEQVPAARWNDDLLLNQHGEVFDGIEVATRENISLPSLFGPGGSEQTALQGYRNMQSLLEVTHLQISELFLSERFAWNLRLANGIKLNLGRSEFIDRLQRFVDIFPLISTQDKTVDYVDLRYDTGLAVGWAKADTTESNKKQRES
ncbi:MAG: cell division protein FtsQ/DivIB [Paraglaciecola sp.]|uniref:cell division protein FtsQ/DivIB n=1 Tax=Pseudomonadati TaxID=3379134 RepID=UPI00273D0B19|nr:cell division protein FtsQ/DivIB [Paraglaciecola sp.]MDP5029723.1 cell division protein FtsQ/DivIB [Paraglaciecola sp.]MDP5041459.1 cell division protein FtsQ/DivIB [Paraglaciecola sp.]MDP5131659.1 cell division protein FtsQ/DivIB [Paraglaciecola sp.]